MVLNLNNIILASENSKRLADFYRRVLGALKPDWSDESGGWFGCRADDGSLAIGPHSEVKGKNQQPGRIGSTSRCPTCGANTSASDPSAPRSSPNRTSLGAATGW